MAPVKPLLPGMPVLITSDHEGTTRGHFYGAIERITPNAKARTVTLTCYDPLRRMGETDVVVPANPYVQRTARDLRVDVLNDFERGALNLCANPEFAVDLSGWDDSSFPASSYTRITAAYPPVGGHTAAEMVSVNGTDRFQYYVRLAPVFFSGRDVSPVAVRETCRGDGDRPVL